MVKALEAISGSDALVKVSPSMALFQLTHLSLVSNYQLTDVTGLEKLAKLQEVRLQNTRLTKAQIDQLKEVLPRFCRIEANP